MTAERFRAITLHHAGGGAGLPRWSPSSDARWRPAGPAVIPRTGAATTDIQPPNALAYCSGLNPTSSLPPISSTGRLIIDGCASISAIAFFSVSPSLSLSGKLAERGAGAVEQRLPPGLPRPALERAALDAGALVVVEGIGDAALVEPGPRLLHRVAVLDAVDRDGLGHLHLAPTRSTPDTLTIAAGVSASKPITARTTSVPTRHLGVALSIGSR